MSKSTISTGPWLRFFDGFPEAIFDEFINFPMKPWWKILPKSAKFAEKTHGLSRSCCRRSIDPGPRYIKAWARCGDFPHKLRSYRKIMKRYMSQIYGHLEKKRNDSNDDELWFMIFMFHGKNKMNYGGLEGFLLMNYEFTWENMTTLW